MAKNRLNVFYGSALVGVIEANDLRRMSFKYSDSWLESPDSFPVSRSLPPDADPYPPERAHSFFANLLPEGLVRQSTARRLGISEDNDFEMLKEIGGECAGALWIGPGRPPDPSQPEYRPMGRDEIASLARSSNALAGVARKGVRLSLAGAQDKLPLLLRDGEFLLPLDGAPSSHILKLPNKEYGDLPANELLSMELARRSGLPVADTSLLKIEELQICLVERFDRIYLNGVLTRLHQEDFCQALGLPHSKKYQDEGGPTFSDCFHLLQDVSSEPILDSEILLEWQIVNLLLGNADGHAKNLSLLYSSDGSIRLAPLYDIVCTLAYKSLPRGIAMPIGSASDLGRIGPRHFDMMADACEVSAAWLRGFAFGTAERFAVALGGIGDELEAICGDMPSIRSVIRTVSRQSDNVLNAFRQAQMSRRT
jgi:serine/threonine-protein kinase HipA